MNAWAGFERRWRDAVFEAMLPPIDELPGLDATSMGWFWDDFAKSAPALLKIGLRVAVWFVSWAAVLSAGRLFHRVSAPQKDKILHDLSEGAYLSRQLIVTLKVVATLAYFSDPIIRARFRGAT